MPAEIEPTRGLLHVYSERCGDPERLQADLQRGLGWDGKCLHSGTREGTRQVQAGAPADYKLSATPPIRQAVSRDGFWPLPTRSSLLSLTRPLIHRLTFDFTSETYTKDPFPWVITVYINLFRAEHLVA